LTVKSVCRKPFGLAKIVSESHHTYLFSEAQAARLFQEPRSAVRVPDAQNCLLCEYGYCVFHRWKYFQSVSLDLIDPYDKRSIW
jgi:hypothetical protein